MAPPTNPSHANPYGFSSSNAAHAAHPQSLHLDLAPQSDFSPFFEEFAPLPSPQAETPNSGSPSQDGPSGSRQSVDEDKRRRNTEASARFRIKKKEREQQLERTTVEMSEKVRGLEEKCRQLERENGWLRGLIVERRENVKVDKKKGKRSQKVKFEEKGDERREKRKSTEDES